MISKLASIKFVPIWERFARPVSGCFIVWNVPWKRFFCISTIKSKTWSIILGKLFYWKVFVKFGRLIRKWWHICQNPRVIVDLICSSIQSLIFQLIWWSMQIQITWLVIRRFWKLLAKQVALLQTFWLCLYWTNWQRVSIYLGNEIMHIVRCIKKR